MTTHPTHTRAWEIPPENEVLEGKYRVESTLGQGGLAIVLGGRHLVLDQRVAIKMLLPQWATDIRVIERFLREGRAAAKIRSEHVVHVFDVGVHRGAPYIVMEYLEGRDLDTVVAQDGPLPISVAVDLVLHATEAIAEAHAAGIVHRDIKPANMLLAAHADGSPCVKVLDFGISKMRSADRQVTNPELVMGSPPYMSPEQAASTSAADERSDVWALGVVLYELLSGLLPFPGSNERELLAGVLTDEPQSLATLRPEVPASLDATIMLCLKREPAERFANVGEMALALAPFGSFAAHASAQRIIRTLQVSPEARRVRRFSPPLMETLEQEERESSLVRRRQLLRWASSGLLVAAAVVALVGGNAWLRIRESAPSSTTLTNAEATHEIDAPSPPPPPPSPPAPPPPPSPTPYAAAAEPSPAIPPPLANQPAPESTAARQGSARRPPHAVHAPRDAASRPPPRAPEVPVALSAPTRRTAPSLDPTPSFASFTPPPPLTTASAPGTSPAAAPSVPASSEAERLFDDRK